MSRAIMRFYTNSELPRAITRNDRRNDHNNNALRSAKECNAKLRNFMSYNVRLLYVTKKYR